MKISLDVYGIKLKVITDHASLFAMIEKYYKPFIVKNLKQYDVVVDLERYSYFGTKKYFPSDKDATTIGTGIQLRSNQNSYYFNHQEISALLDFSAEKPIHIHGKLIPHRFRHIVHILLQGPTRIDKYYNRFIIKTCIHDMVFILLEKKYKTAILHGSAVTNGEKTYIFSGLGGSGKSTLASYFSVKKGYQILSDNYTIVSGNMLYPFPEMTRITKDTQELLGVTLQNKADGSKSYLMSYDSDLLKPTKIDAVFICSYGNTESYQEIKSTDYIFELLYSINTFTKEFPEHGPISLLSYIKKFTTNSARLESLKTLSKKNKFYRINATTDIEQIVKKIENV